MNNQMLLMCIVFGTVVALAAIGYLAFQPAGATPKQHRRRLDKLRERYSLSTETRTDVQMRKILSRQDNKIDSFIGQILPRPAELRKRLSRTGKSWTIGNYGLASGGILVFVTLILALIVKLQFFLALVVGTFLAIAVPHLVVSKLLKKRLKNFVTLFPDAIDLMVRGLRSGLPITESLGIVSKELPDPVSTEFRMVTDKIRIGRTMEQALNESVERIPTPEFKFFIITLSIQRETGGNLAETLSNLSDVLRKRMQMKLKIKAMSSEAKASAWIVGSMPFVMFVSLVLIKRPFMEPFFSDHRMQAVAGGGLLWLSLGIFVMSRMVAFEI